MQETRTECAGAISPVDASRARILRPQMLPTEERVRPTRAVWQSNALTDPTSMRGRRNHSVICMA